MHLSRFLVLLCLGCFFNLFIFFTFDGLFTSLKKLNKYLQMPCKYLKKSFCMDHTCKASFHIQRNSTFVKIINGGFSSHLIFNSRLQFGWMNRYLQLNFWGRVLSRIAFSLSISGPYLTVRHKSPQKLVFWRQLLGVYCLDLRQLTAHPRTPKLSLTLGRSL